jgi:hypothetical protein
VEPSGREAGRRAGEGRELLTVAATRVAGQGRDQRSSPGWTNLPFFARSGSVHAERLKQHGRLFPLFIFEMLTSTRRLRVSGFFALLTDGRLVTLTGAGGVLQVAVGVLGEYPAGCG